jgi:glycerol kinase
MTTRMQDLLLAIDQGTTSTRAIVFDPSGSVLGVAQREFAQHYPAPGWVEHDPEEIWSTTLAVTREAIDSAGGASHIAGIGITNQRETTVVWDRGTGRPVYPAIVWQDRRTAERCAALREGGHEPAVRSKTGLVLDPYFSASKIAWIPDSVDGARVRAKRGELAFGTIDAFLIWRLTDGAVHATDATNASRTSLFDIGLQRWDDELLALFDVPRVILPEVRDSADDFGTTAVSVLGASIPIAGVAGDQQAATVGQACFEPGMVKSTYGTGCFAVLNTGDAIVESRNGLLATVAYRLDGNVAYALEGSIFVAGASVQWLRDGLGVIDNAHETELLAKNLESNHGVYLVPAFVGLGAPHWEPDARGAVFGITRDTGVAHFARAALESVCYQTHDLVEAMTQDLAASHIGGPLNRLRVDGGMVANSWLMQFLADMVGMAIERPRVTETTALGAALLAGLRLGMFASLAQVGRHWQLDETFEPSMNTEERAQLLAGWQHALEHVRSHAQG